MQCLCFNFGVNYSRVSLCNPVCQQDEAVNSGRLFRWFQATPHLHCPPPAPILILVSSCTFFLPSIWTLNVAGAQICTGESGEPILEGHKMPGRRNSAQFTALRTGPEMELSCGQLGVLRRNNCSLGKRVLRSGSLSNLLVGRPKMFTDGKVGTFPNSREKWELCPCSAIQPNKLVDAAAGPQGR